MVRDGSIETILSPAGSVGLMQATLNVWCGICEPDNLIDDALWARCQAIPPEGAGAVKNYLPA